MGTPHVQFWSLGTRLRYHICFHQEFRHINRSGEVHLLITHWPVIGEIRPVQFRKKWSCMGFECYTYQTPVSDNMIINVICLGQWPLDSTAGESLTT